MSTIAAISTSGAQSIPDQKNSAGFSSTDQKINDLVVGKIMPVLVAALSIGCIALAVCVNPLFAVGLVPALALSIIGLAYATRQVVEGLEYELAPGIFMTPAAPFTPNQPVGIRNEGNSCWLASLSQLALNNPCLERKLRAHGHFSKFFDAYRAAQGSESRTVHGAGLEPLRKYLHHYTGGHVGEYTQEDPASALERVCGSFAPGGALYLLLQRNSSTGFVSARHEHALQILLSPGESFNKLFQDFFSFRTDRGQNMTVFFESPPDTLLVQLRRFVQSGTGSTFDEAKDASPYDVPLEMILSPNRSLRNRQELYECDGFIEHLGSSPRGGHYVAYIKRNGKWWYCSDSTVFAISQDQVEAAKKRGYIYSFRKR